MENQTYETPHYTQAIRIDKTGYWTQSGQLTVPRELPKQDVNAASNLIVDSSMYAASLGRGSIVSSCAKKAHPNSCTSPVVSLRT